MNDRELAIDLVARADLMLPNAIRVAATLQLADHIAAGVDTPAALADRTGADPGVLGKLLRFLAEHGLFERAGDRYALTAAGSPLRRDHPISVGSHLSNDGIHGRAALGLVGLLHTAHTGEPAFDAVFGRSFWDDIASDPACAPALRAEGLQEIAWDADIIVDAYDWSGVSHVTDVGGNNGTLLIALLNAHPHLRGTVLDLDGIAHLAGERIAAAGLADRATAVAGSFFDPLPGPSDVYLVSGILGDWSDDDAVRILRRCGEAAGAEGRVLVGEIRVSIAVTDVHTAGFDLLTAAMVPAPDRSTADLDELFERSGLTVAWRGPETAARTMSELRVAEAPVAVGPRG